MVSLVEVAGLRPTSTLRSRPLADIQMFWLLKHPDVIAFLSASHADSYNNSITFLVASRVTVLMKQKAKEGLRRNEVL